MARVIFNNSNRLFYQSVKKSVDSYFQSKKLRKSGNWKLYLKAYILIPLAIGLYVYLLLGSYHSVIGLLLAALLGLCLVCIAFNVMHDACHGSYSRRKWVNEFMGLSMNALGSNAFIWKIKHNVIHHTYTNIDGVDDDLANSFLIRMCSTQRWRPMHRFQFIYVYFLYAISTINWMWGTDFVKYFSRKIHNTPINHFGLREDIIFWSSKLLYLFFYVAVPVYCVGWQGWLAGFLVVHMVMGLALSIVFQLAHVVEKTAFEYAGDMPKVIPTEWAAHEVKTTADFAPDNKVISWLVGGLNFQIEHHLFPQVSHVHYPALSKIVRQQCELFGLPYHYYPTMREAVASHVRVMRRLGRP